MGKSAQGVEAGIAPELVPELGADIAEHGRLEAGMRERGRKLCRARAGAAVELAERQAIAPAVTYRRRTRELACHVGDAADDALGRNRLGDGALGIEGQKA